MRRAMRGTTEKQINKTQQAWIRLEEDIVRLTIGAHELLERSNPPWMLKELCVGAAGTVQADGREQFAMDAE